MTANEQDKFEQRLTNSVKLNHYKIFNSDGGESSFKLE
jgi:hypothetical protein